MEQYKKTKTILSITFIGIALSLGCRGKINDASFTDSSLNDNLSYDVKNALSVKIKHGDSTNLLLQYGGPSVLHDIDYNINGKNSFHITFGKDDISHPAFLSVPHFEKDTIQMLYRFDGSNGIIREIQRAQNNNNNGPYYSFDSEGALKVSGFYKNGYYSGIWRLYDHNGNILETVNSDSNKVDVLKHFKIIE
jgi:hypothetical protein